MSLFMRFPEIYFQFFPHLKCSQASSTELFVYLQKVHQKTCKQFFSSFCFCSGLPHNNSPLAYKSELCGYWSSTVHLYVCLSLVRFRFYRRLHDFKSEKNKVKWTKSKSCIIEISDFRFNEFNRRRCFIALGTRRNRNSVSFN